MPHSLGFLRTNKQKVYKKGVSLATWAWLELEVLGQAAFQRTPHGDINGNIKYGTGPTALVREGWFTVATRPSASWHLIIQRGVLVGKPGPTIRLGDLRKLS